MERQDPDRHRKLQAHIRTGRLRGCHDVIQRQVDDALDWLAAKLPFPIVAPEHVLQDLRDWLVDELAPETVRAAEFLLLFADGEDEPLASKDAGEDATATGGSRARRLDPEEPGTAGRFTTIAISPASSAFFEQGERYAPSGRAPAPRWRTRERKPRRPRITSPTRAAELLVEESGHTITELRATLRRGRPSASTRAVREELANAVARAREQRVAVSALADALQCDPATIWRLTMARRELIARFSAPMDEEERPDSLAA